MDKILFLIDNSDNKFAVKYKEHFLFMFQNMIKQTPKLKHEQVLNKIFAIEHFDSMPHMFLGVLNSWMKILITQYLNAALQFSRYYA